MVQDQTNIFCKRTNSIGARGLADSGRGRWRQDIQERCGPRYPNSSGEGTGWVGVGGGQLSRFEI
jgi:hypothetical protein